MLRKIIVILLWVIFLSYSSIINASNWPYFGYDAAGSYYVPTNSGFQILSELKADDIVSYAASEMLAGDVNGDGKNEVVFSTGSAVYVTSMTGNIITTISGKTYLSMLGDINGDGVLDIGIGSYGTGNISFYSGAGVLLWTFDKSVGYDTVLLPICLLNGKIYAENHSGYSSQPRGVSKIDLTTYQEDWLFAIGPHMRFYADQPPFSIRDGLIAFNTGTPHNGSSASGYNGNGTTTYDSNLYQILIDTNGNQEFCQLLNGVHTDGGLEQRILPTGNIVGFEGHASAYYNGTSKAHLINPSGTTLATRNRGQNTDLNGAFNNEYIVAGGGDGVIEVLNINDLSVHATLNLGSSCTIAAINDIDGDGAKEIIAYTVSNIYIFNMNLVEKWSWTIPSGQIYKTIIADDGDGLMDIIVATSSTIKIIHTEKPKNNFYYSLAGNWENNSFASGPGAPWWMRGALIITSNGSFSGSFEDNAGDPDNVSGVFSITNDGVISSADIDPDFRAVMDLGKTVIVGTNTWDEGEVGTTEIITSIKKADSYITSDLAGIWEINVQGSGFDGSHWWARGPLTINSSGSYSGQIIENDGNNATSENISGTFIISGGGVITSDDIHSTTKSIMDSGKTVIIGTTAWDDELTFSTFVKKASSYSSNDLAGVWETSFIAFGPGAPWWQRGPVTINSNGNYSATLTQKNSGPAMTTGKLNISKTGVITSPNFDSNFRAVMDADKTVIVGTGVWESIAPHSTYIMIWVKKTNGAKKGMPWLPLLLE